MRWLRTLTVAVLAAGSLTACAGVADFRTAGEFSFCSPGPCVPAQVVESAPEPLM